MDEEVHDEDKWARLVASIAHNLEEGTMSLPNLRNFCHLAADYPLQGNDTFRSLPRTGHHALVVTVTVIIVADV